MSNTLFNSLKYIPKKDRPKYIKNLPNNYKILIRKFINNYIKDVDEMVPINENRRKKITFILSNPTMLFNNNNLRNKLQAKSRLVSYRLINNGRKEGKKRKRKELKKAIINSKTKLIPFYTFLKYVNSVNLVSAKKDKVKNLLETLKRYKQENKITQNEYKGVYLKYQRCLQRYVRIKNNNVSNNNFKNILNTIPYNNLNNNNIPNTLPNNYTENNNKKFMEKIKKIKLK